MNVGGGSEEVGFVVVGIGRVRECCVMVLCRARLGDDACRLMLMVESWLRVSSSMGRDGA